MPIFDAEMEGGEAKGNSQNLGKKKKKKVKNKAQAQGGMPSQPIEFESQNDAMQLMGNTENIGFQPSTKQPNNKLGKSV